MPTIRLTQRGIDRLTAGKWLTDFWDQTLPGFGVRVSKTGHKTFVVRYTRDGSKRRITIGAYPAFSLADARDKARELLHAVQRGEDPQAEPLPQQPPVTFGELAADYIENHAKRKKRSWREDQRILRVDILPHWQARSAAEIDRRDVNEILDLILHRGSPIMANRTKALVSKIYNFGIGRGLVEHNPSLGVPQPAKARQRDRVLTEDEIRAVWKALDRQALVMAATFKLRLLTAQRGVEVLTMRWQDIDGEWWTIPAERSKNGLSHRVPLSHQAREILEGIRKAPGNSRWVFASPRKPGKHITAVQKAANRIAEAAGVAFVPHDLRRTAASHMTSLGVPRLVVSKILNHVERGVTAAYDRHSYDEEKREALASWGSKLQQIIASEAKAGLTASNGPPDPDQPAASAPGA